MKINEVITWGIYIISTFHVNFTLRFPECRHKKSKIIIDNVLEFSSQNVQHFQSILIEMAL